MKTLLCAACISFIAAHTLRAAEPEWKPLLDGNDLSGWVNVNGAPETWTIKDGVVACTGKPIGALRTVRQYENFELELEWRHLKPGGNAGIFVWASPLPAVGQPFLRAIEVQVLDNGYDAKGKNEWYTTHGDIFPIHNSTMTAMRPQSHKGDPNRCFPSEERSKPSPEWNHYRIVANDGSIRLSVNGKEVSGGDNCNWRKGHLGLESEGSPTEWRNIKIKELPSTGATPEQSAPAEEGWKVLYNGVDLRGWKEPETKESVVASDWQLLLTDARLFTLGSRFPDSDLFMDVRTADPKDDNGMVTAVWTAYPPGGPESALGSVTGRAAEWQRHSFRLKQGKLYTQFVEGAPGVDLGAPTSRPPREYGLALTSEKSVRVANIFIRELK